MVVLGGMGSITGAVLAAILLTALPELLRPFAEYRMVLYSLLLIVLMIARPQGLLGTRELTLPWAKRKPAAGARDEPHRGRGARRHARRRRARWPRLTLDHVSIVFGGLTAVSDLALDVGPGELVGLIGPNGAGKTTVFNLITGVYTPTSGDDPLRRPRRSTGSSRTASPRRGIARTFQNIRLFAGLTVLDNVAHRRRTSTRPRRWPTRSSRTARSARRRGARSSEQARRAAGHLRPRRTWPTRARPNLPYGSQRRLEIARALAADPKLLLLDEPAAGHEPAGDAGR